MNKKVHIGSEGNDKFASLGIDLSDEDSDKEPDQIDPEFTDQLLKGTYDLLGNETDIEGILENDVYQNIDKVKELKSEIFKTQDSSDTESEGPALKILEPNDSLNSLDSSGYRAIWARLNQNNLSCGVSNKKNWVRMEEESRHTGKCDVSGVYYNKIIEKIDTDKLKCEFREKHDIALSMFLEKLFSDKSYYADSFKKLSTEIMEYTRGIVGER